MKGNNILASLCYFSIFFAPFLFPLVVYFITEQDVKYHAKKALWTHLIPFVAFIIGLAISTTVGLSTQTETTFAIGILITYFICAIIGIYFFIWNIVRGIKVLREI